MPTSNVQQCNVQARRSCHADRCVRDREPHDLVFTTASAKRQGLGCVTRVTSAVACRQPSYQAYFENLTACVRQFLAQERPEGRRVAVSFVAHPETVSELELFRRQWAGLADEVKVRAPHNFSGRAVGLPSQHDSPMPTPTCSFLDDRIAVAADGTVSSCNLDFERKHVLGHVGDGRQMVTLWRHPRRLALRESIGGGRSDAQCSACSRCAGLAFLS